VSGSRALGIGVALVVAAAVVAGLLLLLRPTGTATALDGVAVECVGVDSAGCAAWTELVLAGGPGIHTFDPDDLERVRLGRAVLGVFGDCRAEYFLGRYADAVASETVACP
jgi:hypothetical protein